MDREPKRIFKLPPEARGTPWEIKEVEEKPKTRKRVGEKTACFWIVVAVVGTALSLKLRPGEGEASSDLSGPLNTPTLGPTGTPEPTEAFLSPLATSTRPTETSMPREVIHSALRLDQGDIITITHPAFSSTIMMASRQEAEDREKCIQNHYRLTSLRGQRWLLSEPQGEWTTLFPHSDYFLYYDQEQEREIRERLFGSDLVEETEEENSNLLPGDLMRIENQEGEAISLRYLYRSRMIDVSSFHGRDEHEEVIRIGLQESDLVRQASNEGRNIVAFFTCDPFSKNPETGEYERKIIFYFTTDPENVDNQSLLD